MQFIEKTLYSSEERSVLHYWVVRQPHQQLYLHTNRIRHLCNLCNDCTHGCRTKADHLHPQTSIWWAPSNWSWMLKTFFLFCWMPAPYSQTPRISYLLQFLCTNKIHSEIRTISREEISSNYPRLHPIEHIALSRPATSWIKSVAHHL